MAESVAGESRWIVVDKGIFIRLRVTQLLVINMLEYIYGSIL
jgi:hypothetical protein